MKKIFLVLSMFLFVTNVSALSFNVGVTNIQDEGNNGTIGTIEKINLPNKELDVYFQDIGDEVNFKVTLTNYGDRAGTLKSIEATGDNDKIEYTSNLPDGGLAINGEDTNEVIITAKLKEGAVNGTSSSEIKITYNFDVGSCPDGEILSKDESMCLCPEGLARNEKGVCVKPEKTDTKCETDEIYNETKKICEKKVVTTEESTNNKNRVISVSNPKTLDNIILITLLFIVSGLGIYAVMFKKLQTKKKKVTAGVITGVVTLSLSFTVLAGVFGLDNLLSAIVNPITKKQEILISVNEKIELIETWDGECSLDVADLTPENIFEGGSGSDSDPYQIKTAEQLSCFAKSVNNGETYQNKYIKQTKNIKLNDKVLENVENNTLTGLNTWTPIGYTDSNNHITIYFSGTYNGDNHVISGLYLTDDSIGDYKALFGCEVNATIKNLILSDVCFNTTGYAAGLVGQGYNSLTINNIKTYGKSVSALGTGGVIENYSDSGPSSPGVLDIENTENNIDLLNDNNTVGGIVAAVFINNSSDQPNLILKNVTNNGDISNGTTTGGIIGVVPNPFANALFDNVVNNGNFNDQNGNGGYFGGIVGYFQPATGIATNVSNTGNFENHPNTNSANKGGLFGEIGTSTTSFIIDNCFNSGNIEYNDLLSSGENLGVNFEGMTGAELDQINSYFNSNNYGGIVGGIGGNVIIRNSYNTGDITALSASIGGIVGDDWAYPDFVIENCYNTGNLTGTNAIGGIVGAGGITVTKVYNTGTITQIGSNTPVGGIIGNRYRNAANLSYSYNEGDIIVKSNVDNAYAAGVCGHCDIVKNSYNRGNITSKYAGGYFTGINSNYINQGVENVYNSGDIIIETIDANIQNTRTLNIGGIMGPNGYEKNAYNLGNLTIERNESYFSDTYIGGVRAVSGGYNDNCVNTGSITYKVNKPFTTKQYIHLSGLVNYNGNVTNSFNSGIITLDTSALDHGLDADVFEDNKKHYITFGEIGSQYYDGANFSNNKFNTNSNNLAIGCYYAVNHGLASASDIENCPLSSADLVGTYTSNATPDILSVINGDDAFEIREGEELPTLKVFNQ